MEDSIHKRRGVCAGLNAALVATRFCKIGAPRRKNFAAGSFPHIYSACIWLICGCGIFAITPGWTRISHHGDFITLGGKFPRLMKKEAKARLKEIKQLLLAI